MFWRWTLGVLVLLIALLCWTRMGILVVFDGVVTLDVRFGIFHFRIFPGKEKPLKEQRKKQKKTTETNDEMSRAKKKPFPKPALADIRDAVRTLAPPLKRALAHTRRGIRVDPLCLSLQIGGGEDPAGAAALYGMVNAGIWTVMPVLEQILIIPAPHIHTEVDFDAAKARVQGRAGVSIRIGTALAVGARIAFPALCWLLRYMKKKRKQRRSVPELAGAKAV